MDELEKHIVLMNREQLIETIAKSKYQRTKAKIKFITSNKAETLERWDKIASIYEKLLKDVLKVSLKIEKAARLKYLKPMDDDRRRIVMANIKREMEAICGEMVKECRPGYENQGKAKEFDSRFAETQTWMKKQLETSPLEVQEKINDEINRERKLEPVELVSRYGIDEPTLMDLRLIGPLQEIDLQLKKIIAVDADLIANGVNDMISLCSKYYQKGALKNVVLTVKDLISQATLDSDHRNEEVIRKSQERLVKLLKLAPDSEERIKKVQPLFHSFGLNDNEISVEK